jgi:hypothetical protein
MLAEHSVVALEVIRAPTGHVDVRIPQTSNEGSSIIGMRQAWDRQ